MTVLPVSNNCQRQTRSAKIVLRSSYIVLGDADKKRLKNAGDAYPRGTIVKCYPR